MIIMMNSHRLVLVASAFNMTPLVNHSLTKKTHTSMLNHYCYRVCMDQPILLINLITIAHMFRERRRLKKMRKDRIRLMSTVNETATKRHKHKHKCGEELCKHRKHKKRRKHRKHHHRAESDAVDGQSEELQEMDDENGTESDLPLDDEQDSVNSLETVHRKSSAKNSLRALAAENITAKNLHFESKIQWSADEDMVSSITEDSSGSSYVRPIQYSIHLISSHLDRFFVATFIIFNLRFNII